MAAARGICGIVRIIDLVSVAGEYAYYLLSRLPTGLLDELFNLMS